MAALSPRVSVGMPTRNAERWIGPAIESLLQQSMADFELVISDNASTDATYEICRHYAARDHRIRLISNAGNLGLSRNYNLVFREARAPYFKWASSNDCCHSRLLERCLDYLEQRPDAVLAYPRTILRHGSTVREEPCKDALELDLDSPVHRFKRFIERINLNNLMNGVFRTRALQGTALIQPYLSSDVVLMAEVLLRGPFIEVPEYLFFRSMHPETATGLQSRRKVVEQWSPAGGRMLFQSWQGQWGYFRAVMLAPLSHSEKWELVRYLMRGIIGARNQLWQDVLFSTRGLMSGRKVNG